MRALPGAGGSTPGQLTWRLLCMYNSYGMCATCLCSFHSQHAKHSIGQTKHNSLMHKALARCSARSMQTLPQGFACALGHAATRLQRPATLDPGSDDSASLPALSPAPAHSVRG